jgi:hypothetical protein
MLNSLFVLADVLGTLPGSFDVASFTVVPTHSTNPLMTPEEPSTLALAIIGSGLIAAYAIIGRLRRSQRHAATISKFPSRPIHSDRSKRGAA